MKARVAKLIKKLGRKKFRYKMERLQFDHTFEEAIALLERSV